MNTSEKAYPKVGPLTGSWCCCSGCLDATDLFRSRQPGSLTKESESTSQKLASYFHSSTLCKISNSNILQLLATFWPCLATIDNFFLLWPTFSNIQHSSIFGNFCQLLPMPFGNFCQFLTSCCNDWIFFIPVGNIQQRLTIFSKVWQHLPILAFLP